MISFSILIIAHNEERNIKHEIQEIFSQITPKLKNYEVIVLEDGSTDNTKKIIKNLQKKYNFKFYSQKKRKGVCEAMYSGFLKCRKNYIFFTDTGRKFKLKNFWKLYKYLEYNYDIISANRINRQDQAYRIFLTKAFNLFLNISLGSKFKDIDSGFKIYKRKSLFHILKNKPINSDFLSAEICLKMQYEGYLKKEVNINYYQRDGVSRALPPYKIPKLIFNFLINFFKFSKELKKIKKI